MSNTNSTAYTKWVEETTINVALSLGIAYGTPKKAVTQSSPPKIFPTSPDHSTRSRAVICCVYFLMSGDSVVYVGQSKNFYRRLTQHLNNPLMIFDHFVITECPQAHLNSLEAKFIYDYDPPMNKAIPAFNYRKAYRKR